MSGQEQKRRPGRPPKRTVPQIIEACKGSMGVAVAVARKLGVARCTVDRAIAKYPEVRAALAEAEAELVDLTELKLFARALNDGNMTAIIYILDTKGKSRGYGQKSIKVESDAPLDADRLAALRAELAPASPPANTPTQGD